MPLFERLDFLPSDAHGGEQERVRVGEEPEPSRTLILSGRVSLAGAQNLLRPRAMGVPMKASLKPCTRKTEEMRSVARLEVSQ